MNDLKLLPSIKTKIKILIEFLIVVSAPTISIFYILTRDISFNNTKKVILIIALLLYIMFIFIFVCYMIIWLSKRSFSIENQNLVLKFMSNTDFMVVFPFEKNKIMDYEKKSKTKVILNYGKLKENKECSNLFYKINKFFFRKRMLLPFSESFPTPAALSP